MTDCQSRAQKRRRWDWRTLQTFIRIHPSPRLPLHQQLPDWLPLRTMCNTNMSSQRRRRRDLDTLGWKSTAACHLGIGRRPESSRNSRSLGGRSCRASVPLDPTCRTFLLGGAVPHVDSTSDILTFTCIIGDLDKNDREDQA